MKFLAVVLGCLLEAVAVPALAVLPDEFDVYTDDLAKPGETTLEVHFNTTPEGIKTPSYPGEVVAHHGWRLTPEFSYGLNNDWNIGLYVPTVWAGGTYYAAGVRGKLKWIPVKAEDTPQHYFLGLNFEASRISRRFEPEDFLETKLITGIRTEDWLVAFDPILVWSLNKLSQTPTGALATKLSRKVSGGWAAGAEYYSGFGAVSATLPFNQQSNILFAVVDYEAKGYDLNLGIGRGVTSASDKLTVKTIIEFPL